VPFKESQQPNTFKDSGIGSSAPKGTTTVACHIHDPLNASGKSHQAMDFTPMAPMAPSIISEATTTNEFIARLIPPRPKVDLFTGGFICLLCKIHQNINSDKTWV
jgi:hypothetical protein